VLVELLRRPRYEVFPLPGIEDEVAEHVPPEVTMTVTSSPRRGVEGTLGLTTELRARGFQVVPHLAARLVRDEGHLRELVDRLRELGVRELLLIAGDVEEPVGAFTSSHEVLVALGELGSHFEIGVAGYPEGHPFIRDEAAMQALVDKAPLASRTITQLCLDPRVIGDWIVAVRERGVGLPVVVGIPGVTPRAKLLRISTRIGVGESMRFARKYGNVLGRLLLRGRFGPTYLVEGLESDERAPKMGVAGFHVYTFNELRETERWRHGMLERLEGTAVA
jgi:methylenetetrahydrofolate reductase (NADPH)